MKAYKSIWAVIPCRRHCDIQSDWTWIKFARLTQRGSRPDVLSLLSQSRIGVRNASTLHQSPLAIPRCNPTSMADLRTAEEKLHCSDFTLVSSLISFSVEHMWLRCTFPLFLLWRTGKALWIHRHWTLIGLMAVVYLNYLPPSMRVAVFMSAALGKPPPCPVIYRGTCLL